MRSRKVIEKFLHITISNLIVQRKMGNDWSDSTVNYLLGQAEALQVVLDSEMTWSDASELIRERVDRACGLDTGPQV